MNRSVEMERPIVVSLLVFIFVLSTSTCLGDALFRSNSRFESAQAEKLIRELNLFPKESVNIVPRGSLSAAEPGPKLVEKLFKFPNLADPSVSVEELGHHAGYYKIQHSYDARYLVFYFIFRSVLW